MAKHLLGIDHLVIAVRDLDAAWAIYEGLGFTLTQRGRHSPHMCTGNHCILFGRDYVELLGVLTPTELNKPFRALLERGEGLSGLALATDDAARGRAEVSAAGLPSGPPVTFSRPVELPEGPTEASFNVVQLRLDATLGMQVFFCQHLTRGAVWRPEWQDHANGARGLAGLTLAAGEPAALADPLVRLFGSDAVRHGNGRLEVATGSVSMHVLGPEQLALEYPAIELPAPQDLPQPVAFSIAVDDVQRTAAFLRRQGQAPVWLGQRLCLPADEACGATIEFVRAR
ncbi:MAG: VOC family protein [Alphaproteobacteria bacterium]|nr:VOC family protein [Alphaproteobacteria bacterium]